MDAATLPHAGALATGPLLRWLAAHAVPGLERHDAALGEHARPVPLVGGGWAVVAVTVGPSPDGAPAVLARLLTGVEVRVDAAGGPAHGSIAPESVVPESVVPEHEVAGHRTAPAWVPAVRRWLALDDDTSDADAALADDPVLAPMVSARPGLRIPGAVEPVESAVLAVLGQHVSLAAARTFAGRLVAAHGEPVAEPPGGSSGGLPAGGLVRFPTAAALALAGPDALRAATGVTGARAGAVHALARALEDGLDLSPGQPASARAEVRRELLALPGIGPWTADLIALRVLRDPDVFLGGDLILRRVLGARTTAEATARAEAWRPWRSHALAHLWTHAVFA